MEVWCVAFYQTAAAPASAESPGMTEVALRMHVFRLWQKHRTLLKAEIAQTVSTLEELEAEWKWFASMLAAG